MHAQGVHALYALSRQKHTPCLRCKSYMHTRTHRNTAISGISKPSKTGYEKSHNQVWGGSGSSELNSCQFKQTALPEHMESDEQEIPSHSNLNLNRGRDLKHHVYTNDIHTHCIYGHIYIYIYSYIYIYTYIQYVHVTERVQV